MTDVCPDCLHEVGEHLFHGCTHIDVDSRQDVSLDNGRPRRISGYRRRDKPCLCPRTLGVHK